MLRVAESTAAAYGATVELEYKYIVKPTTNDEASSAIAKGAVEKILGPEGVGHLEKLTGGEDFSYYLDEKPGCFAFIGVKNDEINANFPHHSEFFAIDDNILAEGAGIYAQYALDFLNAE